MAGSRGRAGSPGPGSLADLAAGASRSGEREGSRGEAGALERLAAGAARPGLDLEEETAPATAGLEQLAAAASAPTRQPPSASAPSNQRPSAAPGPGALEALAAGAGGRAEADRGRRDLGLAGLADLASLATEIAGDPEGAPGWVEERTPAEPAPPWATGSVEGEAELDLGLLVPLDDGALPPPPEAGERTSPSASSFAEAAEQLPAAAAGELLAAPGQTAPAPAQPQELALATAAEQLLELAELSGPGLAAVDDDAALELDHHRHAPTEEVPATLFDAAAEEPAQNLVASTAELLAAFSGAAAGGLSPVPTGAELELALEGLPPPEAPRGTLFGAAVVPPEEGMPPPGAAPASPLPPPASAPVRAGSLEGQLAVAGPQGDRSTLELATELFRGIEKVIKLQNLYESRGEACERATRQSFEQLQQLLARGPLRLRLTPYEFLLGEQAVYTSQEDRKGLSYRLFRDGLRGLTILPELQLRELVALLDIMRASGRHSDEDDSITQLWNRDLPHLSYFAVDVFLEGLLDTESIELQREVEELQAHCLVPLHAEAVTADLRHNLAALDSAALEQARQWRQRQRQVLAGAAPLPEQALLQLTGELWQRAAVILDELQQLRPGDSSVPGLLSQILDELWSDERWTVLGAAAVAVGKLQEQQAPARVFAEALGRLATPERLLALQSLLASESPAELESVLALLRILPGAVDRLLVQLLIRLPPGPGQDGLAGLLGERGADLTEWHRRRLRSSDLQQVLEAIAALSSSSAASARQSLREMLRHSSPRVRLESLRGLGEHLGEAEVPALLEGLRLDSRELQDLCCRALERLPGRKQGAALVELLRDSSADEWPPARRRRLLALLVRWGGSEANDFIIKRLAAMNPFRRARLESQRHELLEVVQQVGGSRARQLLEAALASRPPEAASMAIATALQSLEAGR